MLYKTTVNVSHYIDISVLV